MTEYDFQISIYDNGPGVPKAIRDRIFREIVPSETDGTGSGLKHSYDFFREYGGLVTYEPGEHYGSTFHIQFNNKEVPDEREGHDH
jgi:nitrogen-specific signal transduction histidine kinase